MSARSKISWTDATWNPLTGCTEMSPGCDNCYARTLTERFRGTPGHYFRNGFDLQLRPNMLLMPMQLPGSQRIFVNSMSDMFHEKVSDNYIAQVCGVMAAVGMRHRFQLLTKRHGRMRALFNDPAFPALVWAEAVKLIGEARAAELWDGEGPIWPLPNLWLGVSVENQQWADIRIPALLETPAALRWISGEPLLEEVRLDPRWLGEWHDGQHHGTGAPDCPRHLHHHHDDKCARLGWVVVGGESGRAARPMYPAWARSLRAQCAAAGVPFHFKQWGQWRHGGAGSVMVGSDGKLCPTRDNLLCTIADPMHEHTLMASVGKRAAGELLDGELLQAYPEVA